MAQLAIRGHATRGKEVIEILEMLGGKNDCNYGGDVTRYIYTIVGKGTINWYVPHPDSPLVFFTLEKFLEKFPYKVGDKVSSKYLKNYKIEKMEWEDINNRVIYKLQGMGWYSADEIQPYKEETMDRKYDVEEYLKVWKETEKGLEVVVNDRFELKEDNGKFYIIKKQLQYPKTYEECCEVLDWNPMNYDRTGYKFDLLCKLQVLLICRDAYWKIAGEEMGLGKPWEPDWSTNDEVKYVIEVYHNSVRTNSQCYSNTILAFPTAEMRDEFYENFKELIELVKELL